MIRKIRFKMHLNFFQSRILKVLSRTYANQVTQSETELNQRLHSALKYLDLHYEVSKALDDEIIRPRNHPGRMKSNTQTLPSIFKKAIHSVLEGQQKTGIATKGQKLLNKLSGRHVPTEVRNIQDIFNEQREQIQSFLQGTIDFTSVSTIEEKEIMHVGDKEAHKKIKQIVHPWKPLKTDRETCLMYLVSRTPAEFVILHNIFSEIKIRDPDFSPRTFFDFGSGVASGFWALREVWSKPLVEAFHVDVNVHMNDLALTMIKENLGDTASSAGLFFRQFLPSSPEQTYNLVLSGFSLLELPSLKDRILIILKLWQKCDNYLVIVEDGTKAGFHVIMEARNLIIQMLKDIDDVSPYHVFAPCPHDLECPKYAESDKPCRFSVGYYTLPYLDNKSEYRTHSYCYMVLKKGKRTDDMRWPRCVDKTIKRSRYVELKVCTADGKLEKAILTKGKNSRNSYNCAKTTMWGDLLPGELFESEEEFKSQQPKQ